MRSDVRFLKRRGNLFIAYPNRLESRSAVDQLLSKQPYSEIHSQTLGPICSLSRGYPQLTFGQLKTQNHRHFESPERE
jgi:hypothetical protein